MIVKICGITNREDALVAVDGGATALGFNFYPPSPRYVTPAQAQSIAGIVPEHVWKVGLFVNERPEAALGIAAQTGMDILQVHGNAEQFPAGIRLWKAVRVGPDFQFAELDAPHAEAFLLDTPSETLHGGTGQTFDWKLARGAPRKVIIAGGLDENNVRQAIEEAMPWGVDACSRLEAMPGRKDHLKLARFLKAALS
ncbi:MAG: phosphoribosylanthranilate isomerase [Bryobacteraceae bacterium]|jgi:phosphoribosylanthranilate isomerase